MALAIFKFQDQGDTQYRFEIDLGVNRYYTYSIGSGKSQSFDDLPQLSQTSFTSPLIGPLPDSSLGRTVLEVPNQQFDRQNRFIQLSSFRTAEGIGPAISEIVEINFISTPLPASALSFDPVTAMPSRSIETVPFQYRETQPVSSATFRDSVSNVAKAVAAPVLKTVAKVATPATAKKLGVNPETTQQIGTVLQQLIVNTKTPATNGAMAVGSKTQPRSNRFLLSPSTNRLDQANAVATLERPKTSTALSIPSTHVEGMAVSATLAIAPELMALLQKVFTPKTLKAIQSMPPQQALGAITQGLIDISNSLPGGTGTAAARSVAQALSQSDRTTHSLVQRLSIGLSAPTSALEFQRIDSVQLKFTDTTTLMINGRSRLLYRYDQEIAFPLTVETPRPISKGIVQLLVKHPETLEVLIEEKYRLENITSGSLATTPKLSPEQLRSLSPNQDYLVCAALVWQATSSTTQEKKRLGTSLSQLITLVSDYSFDRIEGTAEVVPLNDVDRFRDYWHKVWERQFSDAVQQVSLDCKYYLTLESDRTNHARMETLTKFEGNGATHQEGKLKTGLLMSPHRLNELLPQISDHPSLSEAELEALLSPEFKQQCSYAARSQVEFNGRKGDTVALWAYPEMKLQRVLLKQVRQTNANGQVLALAEHEVYFPIPAIVHFVGACT